MLETLKAPAEIAPNLAAGVRIADHWITVGYSSKPATDGRTRYEWEIIFPDGSSVLGDDLQSGCGGGSLVSGLESLLSFLSACGESLNYQDRTGREGENADLFDYPRVQEFCRQYGEECSMLECEISGN